MRSDNPRQLMRGGMHQEAMHKFFGPDLALGGMASVWTPERIGPMRVRCEDCARMIDSARPEGRCECGAMLPEPMAFW